MIRVMADEAAREIYVAWSERGPITVLHESGAVSEQFVDPGTAPMVHEDEVIDHVLGMIANVSLSRKARGALADALGVDPDQVGIIT